VILEYACIFHKSLDDCVIPRSDLVYGIDYNELLAGFSENTRIMVASPLIEEFVTSKGKVPDLLLDEVAKGKCTVGLVGKELVRTVFVIALRIRRLPENAEDRSNVEHAPTLVKIGEVLRKSHDVKAVCELPGTKRRAGETAAAALDRFSQTDLIELGSSLRMERVQDAERTVFIKDSPTYKIRTRYVRTTVDAEYSGVPETICPPPVPDHDDVPQKSRSILRTLSHRSKSMSSGLQVVHDLLRGIREVVVIPTPRSNDAEWKLYIWLATSDFQKLSCEEGLFTLNAWLNSHEMMEHIASLGAKEEETFNDDDIFDCESRRSSPMWESV